MTSEIINELNSGSVHITKDVIASIAEVEASKIKGVSVAGANVVERISNMNLNKAVDVIMDEENVFITINIVVEYGIDIIEACENIQNKIKETIETMTGLNVIEVNVLVSNVIVNKNIKEAKA